MLIHLMLAAALSAAAPAVKVTMDGDFTLAKGKDGMDKDSNLSGIACRPTSTQSRICLLVDDELQAAQVASYDGSTMKVLGLTPNIMPTATLGEPPAPPKGVTVSKFGEWDGEAVAWSDPWFYVVGSHGLSRTNGKFRHSSFQIARIRLDAAGNPTGVMETSYHLTERLRAADELRLAVAMPVNGGGLNIEGAAVLGGALWLGLRAPSIDKRALLVKLAVEPLFAKTASAEVPLVVPVALGANAGIRDIAMVPDGRLVLLSGPIDEATAPPPALWLFDPATRKLHPLGVLARDAVEAANQAEGIAFVSKSDKHVELLVVFDGMTNGGVRRVGVDLP